MKFTKKSIYVGLFAVLYLIVAFSSFFHACSFFGLANNDWMSIILALAFEIGQAAVLFSLLTSSKDRSRVMPWVLMFMFTLVQVIGNVFSSYKYIVTNSASNLRFFKEPIFIWTDLPDDQATVIIVYLVGAILPVSALLLTSMITNYLEDNKEIQSDVVVNEDVKTIKSSEDTPILGLDNIVEQGPQYVPQELTEEEMIAKLKEMNPELHIGVLDGPPEGEGRSDQQEIDDLKTLLEDKEKEATDLKQSIEAGKVKMDELYNTLDKQDNTINAQSSTIDDLSKKIDIKDKALEDLNTEVAAKEFDLKNKDNEIEDLKRYIEDLKQNISDKENTIAEQNKTIDDLKIEQENIVEESIKEEDKQIKPSHFINLTK